ncbi:MAG: adenylate kinase [Anaerolineae bacterium]|nr:MAG: adenylate kinase [Anaerolineae bacterium]
MGIYMVLIGVQGAGKGTQAKFLVEKFGIPHVSTGDLFRAMKTQDTPLAREVQAIMNAGNLVPDDITNRMVEERLKEPDTQNGVIFDGYPRNVVQAEWLDKKLAERNQRIVIVPVLELDREIAIMRAEGRRYSQDKSRVYNIYFNQPLNKKDGVWVDDVDGQPLIQREDDYRESVEKRIDLYFKETVPLIEYYTVQGLVKKIDASQRIEAVAQSLIQAVEEAK